MAKIETIVFLSLVLDLFAFTIPLPLFPRIIEWYTKREASDPNGFLSRTLAVVSGFRSLFINTSKASHKWDVVLLGGFMGSVFSTLQFLVSPHIGALSDRYGRKKVLLITMAGNILSALVWIQSTSFASYMLSRAIGGLSEGNVQLAIAIISDITTPANRGKALAHVGIAFAICFIIGPPIGAYFASRPIPSSWTAGGYELNIYAVPAFLTLVLLSAETLFLALALPETRGTVIKHAAEKVANGKANGHSNGSATTTNGHAKISREEDVGRRLSLLKTLKHTHFLFLGLFSGVEFTLTFLTFDLFDWTNSQNGMLIGFIGVISALLQGGYVRRSMSKTGEGRMARNGVSSCALGLVLLALVPQFVGSRTAVAVRLLQAAAVCLAFTSATVVNALTAYASLQCDEAVDPDTGKPLTAHPELAKGKALGQFRSSGQLGRAIGPLLACASYWTVGPSLTYAVAGAAMFMLSSRMKSIAVKPQKTS
ncbi:MFS, DHA1 sub-family [Fomitiporia mediterranea MF3/22]|uniref:MFS, DHA1 sub-family n=1 Tax=Fomitiporia mediterranea (strain MF3/22) TaxID=694068 RepID=UPI0004407B9E|nr:MFS, DHA1 sub-family [Fomitiporia mediterranea MF3/22]EJD01228.1 MFS, DHA1 sub-family [Fomitiporia mediterranea MF3/22]